jgi:hypothetical protein
VKGHPVILQVHLLEFSGGNPGWRGGEVSSPPTVSLRDESWWQFRLDQHGKATGSKIASSIGLGDQVAAKLKIFSFLRWGLSTIS